MPGAGRVSDLAKASADAHGCPACPHPHVGPAIQGSPNVNVNSLPALRVQDIGMAVACCGPNMWTATQGSPTVFINGKAAFRKDDPTQHCGGTGSLSVGSSNVIVDSGASGGSAVTLSASQGSGSTSGAGTGHDDNDTTQTDSETAAAAAAAAAAAQAANQNKGPDQTPQQSTATWKVQYDDGTAINDISAHYEGRTGPKDVTGSSGNVSGVFVGDKYDLELKGTLKAQGVLQDEDGNPVPGANLTIKRTFGPDVFVTTDGSGKYEVDGLITDELYDVTIDSAPGKATVTLVDENGRPKIAVFMRIISDTGVVKEGFTDADGKFTAEGLLPGEGYSVIVDPGKLK